MFSLLYGSMIILPLISKILGCDYFLSNLQPDASCVVIRNDVFWSQYKEGKISLTIEWVIKKFLFFKRSSSAFTAKGYIWSVINICKKYPYLEKLRTYQYNGHSCLLVIYWRSREPSTNDFRWILLIIAVQNNL